MSRLKNEYHVVLLHARLWLPSLLSQPTYRPIRPLTDWLSLHHVRRKPDWRTGCPLVRRSLRYGSRSGRVWSGLLAIVGRYTYSIQAGSWRYGGA